MNVEAKIASVNVNRVLLPGLISPGETELRVGRI